MSGICGWIGPTTNQSDSTQILQSMATGLRLHGEYQQKILVTGNAALATVSRNGCHGIYHQDSLQIAFEGEIVWRNPTYLDLANRQGHGIAIAQCYCDYGVDCLKHIHGPFVLAISDSDKKRSILAIDRLGIQRLCYEVTDNLLVFGSTTHAVKQYPCINTEIDPQAVYNYLYFHTLPAPHTIYRNLDKLLPAQCLQLIDGKARKSFYWQLEYQDTNDISIDGLSREFRPLLEKTVTRAITRENIGAFLSGGTDSSTMAGILSKVSGEPVNTYSIGFDVDGFDETEYARITARYFGTQHHEYYVTPRDVFNAIPLISQCYDEPFGNASSVPTYYCAMMAKEDGIDTMIAGDGGDELFAGNERYLKQNLFEYYHRIPALLRKTLIEPVFMNLLEGITLSPVRKIHSYITQANIPLPDRLESYNFLRRTTLDTLFTEQFLSQIDPMEPVLMNRDIYNQAHSMDILHRMLHLDMKQTLADNDLRKVETMCEMAGTQVRYPLLDEEMVEFSARIPANLKIKGQALRYFFKQALKDFLPPETLSKPKHGFGLPFGFWIQEYAPLRELAHDSMSKFSQRGILHQKYIDDLQNKHKMEHASYYGVMIWVIMMLEQWLEYHVDTK